MNAESHKAYFAEGGLGSSPSKSNLETGKRNRKQLLTSDHERRAGLGSSHAPQHNTLTRNSNELGASTCGKSTQVRFEEDSEQTEA